MVWNNCIIHTILLIIKYLHIIILFFTNSSSKGFLAWANAYTWIFFQEIFGTVSYTPGETVKRPTDADSPLREVISKLRGHPLSEEKDRGAWNTGIRYMAPAEGETQSALSRLEDNLRVSKGMKPRARQNKPFNNNGLEVSFLNTIKRIIQRQCLSQCIV